MKWDKGYLIYGLMCDNTNINIGAVIFSSMKKACYQGNTHRFGGLLTKFFRNHGFKEEALNYKPILDINFVDVSRTKGITMVYGMILIMLESRTQNDEITT